jgi:hypothetical protein
MILAALNLLFSTARARVCSQEQLDFQRTHTKVERFAAREREKIERFECTAV